MGIDLKQLIRDFKNDDSLPPFDDNDDFFNAFNDEQKFQYLYEGLKTALKMFVVYQKDINLGLVNKVSELESRLNTIEKRNNLK